MPEPNNAKDGEDVGDGRISVGGEIMPKLHYLLVCLSILLVVIFTSILGCGQPYNGEQLYQQAQNLENQGQFSRADALYQEAYLLLSREGQSPLLQTCREGVERIVLFQSNYPYTEQQVKDRLVRDFPAVPEGQISGWLTRGEIDRCRWDNEEHYDINASINTAFRHLDLLQANPDMEKSYREFFRKVYDDFIAPDPAISAEPYRQPATYRGTQTLNISRDKLPATGVLQIWFPLPINSGPQAQVRVESIRPDIYVKQPPDLDGDIGLLYMEVPLAQLQTDLNIQVQFTFTHFQQKYSLDPADTGIYLQSDPLYREYTQSRGNIEITPEIAALARKIAGNEKHPYLMARSVYDYIVDNVKYALTPHTVMWPRTPQTESAYVQQYLRGDCGAQSIYFCALCRSLGIPARCTGGWQLYGGQFGGHFWAEFYLPDYGWLPVDPTFAEFGLYPQNLTDEERQRWVDYFFGSQDSLRCTVQLDVDEPLVPLAEGLVLQPVTIQRATGLCSTMTDDIPGALLGENWQIECERIVTDR
jgi:transglutaminase-like putative cysteine protease